MKKLLFLLTLLAALGLRAADAPTGELLPASDQDAAWLAEARAAYPLTTCLVAGEELGGMGKPADYIYRQAGQPDRLVRFCCKMCAPKFKKEPEKYLVRLTAAADADRKPAPPPKS